MGRAMQPVTHEHLKRAVYSDDRFPARCSRATSDHLVGIMLKTVGLASLHRAIAIDIGNGYVLVCTTQPAKADAEVPG